MTDKTPQFPGKPAQTGAAPKQPWADAICPFLTAGEIARTPAAGMVQTLGPAKKSSITAQPCLGPKCMLFATLRLDDGQELHGCSPTMTLNQQLQLNRMVSTFMQAAEAGARAEAEAAIAKMGVSVGPPPADSPQPPIPSPAPTPSPLTAAADKAEAPTT